MTRVLLINPPSPEKLSAPLLGQQYVAAALLAHGCQVSVIDAAAQYFDHDANSIRTTVEDFQPEIVGIGLFTRWVLHAYGILEALKGRDLLLVAGGPHATACPQEVLEQGFDVVIVGEAEESFVKLANCVERKGDLGQVPGLCFRGRNDKVYQTSAAPPITDLDRLPFPQIAQRLYDPKWYSRDGRPLIPGGILTSRGCPAGCIFCANYVTGRRFRYRSAENVVPELNGYHTNFGIDFFAFWDDALTTNADRVYRLCSALEQGIEFELGWSAITRANMVTPRLLKAMKRAGLKYVTLGVESGDNRLLRAIKKGITTEQVVSALEWAKSEGLQTICNFMFGFPQDTLSGLERTLHFMEKIAPLVDFFNPKGVVVPFPGTPLYVNYHQAFGFTNWWLREKYTRHTPLPLSTDLEKLVLQSLDDPILELDFFHYTYEIQTLIRRCHQFKAEHNLRRLGLPIEPISQLGRENLP